MLKYNQPESQQIIGPDPQETKANPSLSNKNQADTILK